MAVPAGRSVTWTALVASFALSGCQAVAPAPTVANPLVFSGLGGTSWQLVEFQSMDDSQGTTRSDDSGKYTITFNRDGSAALRLDCNRGTAPWRNDIANATGGSLFIGPLAVTKALCPEPSMGEFLERQLGYVRSFTVRDGRLHMALMADGGLIVWRQPDGSR